ILFLASPYTLPEGLAKKRMGYWVFLAIRPELIFLFTFFLHVHTRSHFCSESFCLRIVPCKLFFSKGKTIALINRYFA
ncbi:hypothetical protein QNI19_38395, partial [Cytophagaceae bacterium DM2B3-1]